MIMSHIANLDIHGVFTAPLVTDIIVFFVAIGLECSEFKRLDILKEQDD